MPKSCSKQVYVQGFYCESITLKNSVNIFDRIETIDSIYEGVVEPSYKRPTQADANHAGHSRHKRGEVASSWTFPEKSDSTGKRRKRHVDSLTGKLKYISSTAPDILQMNIRSWETLELSILIVGLLRTEVATLSQENN